MNNRAFTIFIITIIIATLTGVSMVYLINYEKNLNFHSDARNFTESDIKTKEDLFEIIKKVNSLESVKIISKEIYPEEKIVRRFLLSNKKEREDFIDEEVGNITAITDFDKMEIYDYYPEVAVARKKELVKENSLLSLYGGIPEFFESEDLTILGEDTINGKECVVIEYSMPDRSVREMVKTREWIWKDYGLPVKGEILALDRGRVEIENEIEFVDIPDEMFRLPRNVHLIDESQT